MLFHRRTTFQNFVKIAVFRQGFRLLVFQGLHYKRMQTRFVVAEIMDLLSRAKCCPSELMGAGTGASQTLLILPYTGILTNF